MWPEFWPWAAWALAGRPLPQPPEAKALAIRYHRLTGKYGVPSWAWLRLGYMKVRPKLPVPMSAPPAPFNGRGMFLLEPRGGVEDIRALRDAGFTYALLNIGHVSGGAWETTVIPRCRQYGVEFGPWQRVYDRQRSVEVEDVADLWGSRFCGHNLESEAASSYRPIQLLDATAGRRARQRIVITEPWAQNGAGWGVLGEAGWTIAPEAFLNADARWDPAVCVEHARAEAATGAALPAFGWGQWSDATRLVLPGEYLSRWRGPFAVYFGDGREARYPSWN
jgi:hypothetical protein